MNTPIHSFRPAPRLAAFAFAAFMTLAMLLGVGQLANSSAADVLMAHAAELQDKA